MKAIRKYLDEYAEPEAQVAAATPGSWQQVLVVPAYQETPDCLQQLLPAFHSHRGLLILVLNRPDSDPNSEWAEPWRKYFQAQPDIDGIHLSDLNPHCQLMLVDRCIDGEPLHADQGVGLARKIGADIACHLIDEGRITTHWIHSSDADVVLPADYFESAPADNTAAAVTYPFRHAQVDGDATPLWPTLLYEWHIRYYAAGLKFAKSPWAFTTVGSTLALNYEQYAMARGFPKRSAAEDFYLLNKVAKLGDIIALTSPELTLSARHSTRVPFGTGRASARISALTSAQQFSSYHPACFDELAGFNRWLVALGNGDSGIADCDPIAAWWLEEQPIPTQICALPPGSQKSRQLKEWFDAFRTLKFIHAMRDHQFANLALPDILKLHHPAIDPVLAAQGLKALETATNHPSKDG